MKSNFWKILIILMAVFSFTWISYSLYKISRSTAPDFRVLWQGGRDFLSHASPYADNSLTFPFLLPPISSIFYVPFSLINYKMAQVLFSLISLFSLIGGVYFSLKIVFKHFSIYVFLLASSLALLSFPTKFTFGMGQVNTISLLALVGSYYLYKKGNEELSGLLFGISIISKPTFAIFILFFLLKHSWKVILYTAITLIFGALISVLIGGVNDYFYWVNNVLPAIATSQGKTVYYNQGFSGFIARISTFLQINQLIYNIILVGLPILSSYLTLKIKDEDISFSLFIITLLIVDPLSWQHHFVWLVLPFVVVIKYAIKMKNYWIWSIIGVAYLLVSWNFKNPSYYVNFPLNLVLSNMFYAAILLYFLLSYSLVRYKKL